MIIIVCKKQNNFFFLKLYSTFWMIIIIMKKAGFLRFLIPLILFDEKFRFLELFDWKCMSALGLTILFKCFWNISILCGEQSCQTETAMRYGPTA